MAVLDALLGLGGLIQAIVPLWRRPHMRLFFPCSGEQNGDTVSVRTGKTSVDPEPYDDFLMRKDDRYMKATGRGRAMVQEHRAHLYTQWAENLLQRFYYQAVLVCWPIIEIALVNDGRAYAHGVLVEIDVPENLRLIFVQDLPSVPLGLAHPKEVKDQGFSEFTELRVPWSPVLPHIDIRGTTTRSAGLQLADAGTRITWQVGDLPHQYELERVRCAIAPPQAGRYQMEYRVHYKEAIKPHSGKLTISVEFIPMESVLEQAWQRLNR